MLELFKPKHTYSINSHNHKRKTVLDFEPGSSKVIARYDPSVDCLQVWRDAGRDKKKRREDFSVEGNGQGEEPVSCDLHRQDWEVNDLLFY
jgi:hypothetical protein